MLGDRGKQRPILSEHQRIDLAGAHWCSCPGSADRVFRYAYWLHISQTDRADGQDRRAVGLGR